MKVFLTLSASADFEGAIFFTKPPNNSVAEASPFANESCTIYFGLAREDRGAQCKPSSAITLSQLMRLICASDIVLRVGNRIVAVLRLLSCVHRPCGAIGIECRTRRRGGVTRRVGRAGATATLVGLTNGARRARRMGRGCRVIGRRWTGGHRTCHWTRCPTMGAGCQCRRCNTERKDACCDAVVYAFHEHVPSWIAGCAPRFVQRHNRCPKQTLQCTDCSALRVGMTSFGTPEPRQFTDVLLSKRGCNRVRGAT